MRRHYESLNYLDGQPNMSHFKFSRAQGQSSGIFARAFSSTEYVLEREDVERLRDMLNEVLEDWK